MKTRTRAARREAPKHLPKLAEGEAVNVLIFLRDFVDAIERHPERGVGWAVTVDPIRADPRLRTLIVTIEM